jgi:SAM-dependent methyltransferase
MDMTEQPFAQADPRWLALIGEARAWFAGPLGQQMLAEERPLIEAELSRFFGGYLVQYGPVPDLIKARQIRHSISLGAPFPGVEVACEEEAWPLGVHGADLVVLQHGLDFSLSPHGLLREAARSVRPGGHLLIIGINPWSSWGMRHYFVGDGFRQARCIAPSRVYDWLNLLGFSLEKRRFGCYRPPLVSQAWRARLAGLEHWGSRWQAPGAGFYLLVARKLAVGVRPLRQARREPMGKLIPMPVIKISRRNSEHLKTHE